MVRKTVENPVTETPAPATQEQPAHRSAATRFFVSLWPAPIQVNLTERVRAVVGAGVGILVAALLTHWFAGLASFGVWLIAPLGAAAVLVFAVPSSPLAQPWSVVMGNVVSALVGVACVAVLGQSAWAGAAAVGLAVAAMFSLRCLNPPGGATALLMVLGHITSFQFVLFPVLLNMLLLVAVGAVYNNLTGRRYPHAMAAATVRQAPGTVAQSRFSAADLDAAMAHYNQVLDVDRIDLTELLHQAELAAYERNLGTLRSADIMSVKPITADFAMPLDEAWQLMRDRNIKALPVVDKARHIVGIVTLADFMRQAGLDAREGIGKRLRALVQRDGSEQSDKPEVVGQIMTRKVRVAGKHGLVIDLVPLFSESGHHHIPIIDDDKHLVGIITQSDLVSALYRVVRRPE